MSMIGLRASSGLPSCVYVSAEPLTWELFAGIPRYTARLALALATHVPVRFFMGTEELVAPEGLDWSQDQDLELWGRTLARGERRPLGTPAGDCIGLYCQPRSPWRTFSYEVNILHDFCAMTVPWAFPGDLRDLFVRYSTDIVLESDLVVAVSHSTKADASSFSPLESDQVVVAHPGPSLCVGAHGYRDPVVRSDRICLVVSTIEPRKNARFLFDWFHKTTLLPADMELWWVGRVGWEQTEADLERMAFAGGGRRVRLLGNVSDAELCRLYQVAGLTIYPSRYEGFGFPILDSLRHGTPVLASCTSSMAEFEHPGVFFFGPNDAGTLDGAWRRLQECGPTTIARTELDGLYSWDRVARAVLDGYARNQWPCVIPGMRDSGRGELREGSAGVSDMPVRLPEPPPTFPLQGGPAGEPECQSHFFMELEAGRSPERGAARRMGARTAKRIGIGPFMFRSVGHNRGLGRYVRTLVSALVACDRDNSYVFYCPEGLIADQLPRASNVEIRLLLRNSAQDRVNFTQALTRVITTNSDGLDVFLMLDTPALALSACLPFQPPTGLKVAALVHDVLPFFFPEIYCASRSEAERLRHQVESLERLGRYDALLATSEAVREGLLAVLEGFSGRVEMIGLAADDRFFFPDRGVTVPVEAQALFSNLGIRSPFVLSVGSMEYQRRDNLLGLIEAFAMLPAEVRDAHQLVLSYDLPHQTRKRASQRAAECGVLDRLVLLDRLAVHALRFLYQRCAAFVSLTSYEETAVPILEAMHCGAPMVVGESAAQLEVVGDAGLAFHVTDPRSLRHRLWQVLNEPERARQLSERAVAQAGRSSSAEAAGRVLDVLQRLHVGQTASKCG